MDGARPRLCAPVREREEFSEFVVGRLYSKYDDFLYGHPHRTQIALKFRVSRRGLLFESSLDAP